jgi:hypothetical protein
MPDERSDINTITNSGSIGAIAVGRGATAIQAGGNFSVTTAALDAQFTALEHLIEQHQDAAELTALLKEAIALTRSGAPSDSMQIWDKIALYGGAIGSIVSGITGMIGLM